MDLGLQGKKALVLGSSGGLGFTMAKALADEGATVCLTGRDEGRLQKACGEITGSHFVVCNLDEKGAGTQVVKSAAEKLNGLDILITNTGGPPYGEFSKSPTSDWETAFYRLWISAVESIREALPIMRKNVISSILMSLSTSAIEPIPGLTTSNGLRAGIIGLMKSIMVEEAPNNIRINALLPGSFRTEHLMTINPDPSHFTKQIPMGRLGEPKEYGDLAAFLSSEKASYITGQAIAIDGGLVRAL